MGLDHSPVRDPALPQPQPLATPVAQTDHLAELKANVSSPWLELADKIPTTSTNAEVAKTIRNATYKLLWEKKPGYESFAAYLAADVVFAPYAAAAKAADDAVVADRQPYQEIVKALGDLVAAQVLKKEEAIYAVHGACMSAYGRLSAPGRFYLKDLSIVNDVTDPAVKTLLRGETKTLPLEPPEKPADAAAANEDEKLKPVFEGLKKRIMADDPNVHDANTAANRKQIAKDLHDADGRVLDMLRADVQVSLRLAAIKAADAGNPNQDYMDLSLELDSAQQLWWSIMKDDAATQFTKIKGYLEARPGLTKGALANRSRILMNDSLAGLIKGFSEEQQNEISRLIARGSATSTPIDTLNNPSSAEEAVKAAVQVVAMPTFQDMKTDQLFRTAIEKGNNKVRANVDGLFTTAYEVCMRAWGIIPGEPVKDPESAMPTDAVNPAAEAPLNEQENKWVEGVFNETVDPLCDQLDDTWVRDSKVVGILTKFENKCAEAWLVPLFRRAHMHPGVELTKRCNAKLGGNVRMLIEKGLSEDTRQVVLRVLGIRVDAAVVGKVGGTVQLAEDQQQAKAGGKMPLMQALREVKVAGDATMAQITRNHAEEIANKLDATHLIGGCKASDITSQYDDYAGKFGCNADAVEGEKPKRVHDLLAELTGMPVASIHPIELLSNTFRDLKNAKGDLASRISERVTEGAAGVLAHLGLDATSVAKRAEAAKEALEPAPAGKFAEQTKTLWDALVSAQKVYVNDNSGDVTLEAPLTAVATALKPAVPTAPQQPAGATEPSTFAEAYKKAYGIEPRRHVVEVCRAIVAKMNGKHLDDVAKWASIFPDEIIAEQKAPQLAKEPEDLPTLTKAQAKETAQKLWDNLHKGDVVKVRAQIDGRRADEQQMIKLYFAQLSGGIEFEFYCRQALESAKSPTEFTMVGGEGVHAAGTKDNIGVDSNKELARTSDERSWTEMVDIASKGTVGILTRFQVALDNGNKNEIFRLADDATKDERRLVLGDEKTMGLIRAKLEGAEYERVSATLAGTADMTTKLLARSEGDVSGPWSKLISSTDKEGMVRDIKDYAKRRKEFHMQKLEANNPDDPNIKEKVTALVKGDLLAVYNNPDVRAVIESEFNTGWIFDTKGSITGDGKKLEGMLLNGGEENGLAAMTSDGFEWSSDVLAQIRTLSVEQRTKYRNDPAFLKKAWEKCTNILNRKLIMLALQSNEPPGEDHIGKLLETSTQTMSLGSDTRKLVARLSKDEIERLRAEPELVSKICEALNKDEQDRFRKLLGINPAGALADLNAGNPNLVAKVDGSGKKGADGVEKFDYQIAKNPHLIIDEAELQRLDQVKQQSQLRLRLAAERSWLTLLGEAVEVYKADFTPKFKPIPPPKDPPPPGAAFTADDQQKQDQAELTSEGKKHDKALRETVWADVKDIVFKAADQNHSPDKNDGTIYAAVMKSRDPSNDRLSNSFSKVSKLNDDEEIEKTIKEASDEIIIDQWASIRVGKFNGAGGASFQTVYTKYKDLKKSAKEGDPPSPELTAATQAFQRYVIEPSSFFEDLVLPKSGSFLSDHDQTTKQDQQLGRSNPQYAKYRGFLNERIRGLDAAKVATAIGADGKDAELVGSKLRGALTSFQQAKEQYAKDREIGGQGMFGSDEGRELDRQFGDYKKAINQADDGAKTGEITDKEKRKLDKYDEDFKARAAEYTAARDEAATIASQVVAAAIAIAVTACSAGVAGPGALMMYGALSAAAAATGEVVTKAAIQGSANYDIGSDGVYTIVTAAVTGAVAAGASHYAGGLTKAILAEESAAAQGASLVGAASKPAPLIKKMLDAGVKAGVQTTIQSSITGLTDAVGSGLNPAVWVHGWDEGWHRALEKVAASVRAKPYSMFKEVVSAAVGGFATGGLKNMNEGNEVKPGEKVGLDRALKQVVSDMPNNFVTGATSTTIDVAAGDVKTPKQAIGQVAGSVVGGVQSSGVSLQDGSAHMMKEATRFGVGQITAYPECFKSVAEREMYLKACESLHPKGQAVTAQEFSFMRDVVVRTLVGDNPKFAKLSAEEQQRFLDYVRGGTGEEVKIRAMRDPAAAINAQEHKSYDKSSPVGQCADAASTAEKAVSPLGEIQKSLQGAEQPATKAESDATLTKTKTGLVAADEAIKTAQAAIDKITGQLSLTPDSKPEFVDLQTMLGIAQSAKKRAQTMKELFETTAFLVRMHGAEHGWTTKPGQVDVALVVPGEVPTDAKGDEKKKYEKAKEIYEKVKKDPYADKSMAEMRWAQYLRGEGINVSGPEDTGLQAGIKEIQPENKPVKESDHAVANTDKLVGDRPLNTQTKEDLAKAAQSSATAFNEVASTGSFEKVKHEGELLVVKVQVDGTDKELHIQHVAPATTNGELAAMKVGADGKIEVWVSDKIANDQHVRALGAIVAQAIAVGSKKSKAQADRAAVLGQVDAMLTHLEQIKGKEAPGKAAGSNVEEVTKNAIENSKWESPGRLSAEIDMLLATLGAQKPGPEREQLLKELPAAAVLKLKLHFEARPNLAFNEKGVLKEGEVQKPTETTQKGPDSTVLPAAPGAETVHPYTAADQKSVVELQLVFEQIKECDLRIRQRDQKDTASKQAAEIAKGETMRRALLVERAKKLMGDLQLGGNDPKYYEARLKELEAVFPGVKDVIGPAVKARVEERTTQLEWHAKAEAARAELVKQCAEVKKRVAGTSPFFTDRVIVGEGVAGLTDAATLGGLKKGESGFLDPAQLLVIGGPDLLARMAATDANMRWGQRTEIFDPGQGFGETHAMFKGGGEGSLQALQEDGGDFTTVGAMNDAMDLVRQRLGVARLEAKVISVESKADLKPGAAAWHEKAGEHTVRVRIEIGGVIQEVYCKHTDITTGLGALAAPDETVLSKADREKLFAGGDKAVMFGGDSVLSEKGKKESLAGQRVLVLGYGPTAAWAAVEAAKLGAIVDWTGSGAKAGGNQATLESLSVIDRIAEAKDPSKNVHTSLDRVVKIDASGGGAKVTYAHDDGGKTTFYEVQYQKIALSMGYDATGARPTNDPDGTPKSMLGDTKMKPGSNGAPVLESYGGDIRVMGGAGFGNVNAQMTPEEAKAWEKQKAAAAKLSADSPANDTRVMEYQSGAIAEANKGVNN